MGLDAAENDRRALRAQGALDAYQGGENEPYEYLVKDLLTDLRHFCASRGLDFAALDQQASRRYRDET